MEEKPHSEEIPRKGAQTVTIEAALSRLGVQPIRAGFERLAAEVGIRWDTIYKAWLGSSNLGKAALRQVESVAAMNLAAGKPFSETPGTYTTKLRDVPLRLPYIPVLSKAHAGTLTGFEELPKEWHKVNVTTCRDEHAFGLVIEGDCMEPDFRAGEIAVPTPSSEPVSGDVVVARLLDDSVVLRTYTVNDARAHTFRLSCKNKAAGYLPLDLTWNDVVWLYPVHSAVRSVRR